MSKFRPGFWGWVTLVLHVIVVDSILIRRKHASLSEVFGDSIRHPIKRKALLLLWAILTLHLFSALMPERIRSALRPYDPIGYLARKIQTL